jgi:transposase-like protein
LFKQLGKRAGRIVSQRGEGLETYNAGADPPQLEPREWCAVLHWRSYLAGIPDNAGLPKTHEVDESMVGGRTRGEGRGVHHMALVVAAVDIRQRKPGTKLDKRKGGRYAGRVRFAVVPNRSAKSLCGFVKNTVEPGTLVVTDDWKGYTGLEKCGYKHFAATQLGDASVTEECLPIIHLVFANLKSWLLGTHHGVSHQHLQAYLNEFTFRFNVSVRSSPLAWSRTEG